jgi:hypothetical protein
VRDTTEWLKLGISSSDWRATKFSKILRSLSDSSEQI